MLINNAALNPKLTKINSSNLFRKYSIKDWNKEIEIGLTGAFLTSKIIGGIMSKTDGGVIINISSDLGLIAPDNRIYNQSKKQINVKPVSYSVIKHGIIGLTKYLATYWQIKIFELIVFVLAESMKVKIKLLLKEFQISYL